MRLWISRGTFHLWLAMAIMAAACIPHSRAAEHQEPMAVAVIGRFAKGPVDVPIPVGAAQFTTAFGSSAPQDWPAEIQARRFFAQGGTTVTVIRISPDLPLGTALEGNAARFTGRHALPLVRDFGILVCPELTLLPPAELPAALATWKAYLEQRQAMLILDPPPGLATVSQVTAWVSANVPLEPRELVLYFPYVLTTLGGVQRSVGASGTMAAAWLKNDAGAGVWESPTGVGLPLVVEGLSNYFPDAELGDLNQASIAPLRRVTGSPASYIPWGARHLNGVDAENRYISTQRPLQWISTNLTRMGTLSVNRANNAALWNDLRTQATDFLQRCYTRGAFVGTTPGQAYFVQCGLGTTMTQADVDAGRVILQYGAAFLKPSEFVIRQFTWDTWNPARVLPEPRLMLREGLDGMQVFQLRTPGASHLLRFSTTLAPGEWTNAGPAANGDGTWWRTAVPISGPKRFYRSEQTALPGP